MADRKITVLNPAGYQELFQSGDNLKVDGSVDLQSNTLTGVPTPGTNGEAANKQYVDDELNTVNTDLSNDINNLQSQINAIPTAGNGSITLIGARGVTISGDNPFTLDQNTDADITLTGPDLSNFVEKPGTDGDFIITESSGTITYSEIIDGGTYS